MPPGGVDGAHGRGHAVLARRQPRDRRRFGTGEGQLDAVRYPGRVLVVAVGVVGVVAGSDLAVDHSGRHEEPVRPAAQPQEPGVAVGAGARPRDGAANGAGDPERPGRALGGLGRFEQFAGGQQGQMAAGLLKRQVADDRHVQRVGHSAGRQGGQGGERGAGPGRQTLERLVHRHEEFSSGKRG